MKKLNKHSCACIGGYDINTGNAKGEDYTQQATPSERQQIWNLFKVIEVCARGDAGNRWHIVCQQDGKHDGVH
jgi:hypothetical protein